MKIRNFLLATLAALSTLSMSAQPLDAEFFTKHPDCAGGIYYTYHYEPTKMTPVPKGYKPIYVSHFGRHGSRWHASADNYERSQRFLNKASDKGVLTPFGEKLQAVVNRVADRAHGRTGELSQQGINEHRGIAERMYRNFPMLFKGKNVHIESRSTNVPRCILSMAAFDARLKELNPSIDIYATTNDNWHAVLIPSKGRKYNFKEAGKTPKMMIDSTAAAIADDVLARIYKPEFRDEIEAEKSRYNKLVRNLFYLSIIMQDTEGDERIDDVFTGEERMKMWEQISRQRYATFANSEEWGDGILYDGSILMREVVRDADDFLVHGGRSAFLRFGHDVTVIAALAAMQVEGECARTSFLNPDLKNLWADFRITPMATNLQFIFYRDKTGDVIVKLLHNEKECRLPIKSDIAPYYHWKDMRRYFIERADQIDRLPMVRKIVAASKKKKSSKSKGRADR